MSRTLNVLPLLALFASAAAQAGDVHVSLNGLGVTVPGATGSATPAPAASCAVAVPAGVHVVKGETMLNDAGGTFLVCPGAKATFNGAGSTVYSMGAAQLFVNGAGINVTATGATTIMVTGANNHVVSDNVGMVATVGVGDTVGQCATVALDINAVKQGC